MASSRYVYLVPQSRRHVPNILSLLWLGMYAPDVSTYVPLYIASDRLPSPLVRGSMHAYTTDSIWWNFCVVGNYAARFYSFSMRPVRALQSSLELELQHSVDEVEAEALKVLRLAGRAQEATGGGWSAIDAAASFASTKLLTAFTISTGEYVNQKWKEPFPLLLAQYRDGYVVNTEGPVVGLTRMFYPRW